MPTIVTAANTINALAQLKSQQNLPADNNNVTTTEALNDNNHPLTSEETLNQTTEEFFLKTAGSMPEEILD